MGGGSLFDDFFGRFFEEGAAGGADAVAWTPQGARRETEQVDVTQFFSDSTTQLLQWAAQQAVEWGSPGPDERAPPPRRARGQRGAARSRGGRRKPRRATGLRSRRRSRRVVRRCRSWPRTLKGPLLAAYHESQALGTSYIGPEHVLLALAADDESEAGRLLNRFGLGTPLCAGPWCAASKRAVRLANPPARPRRSTSTAGTSRRWPAKASSTQSSGGRRRSRLPSRSSAGAPRTTPS